MSKLVKIGYIDLEGSFKEFCNDSKGVKFHRYNSFYICHKYFERNRGSKLIKNEELLERGCVYLAAYLASWGMYRGSTKILQRSAMCLCDVISYIAEPKNDEFFRRVDLDQYNNEGVQQEIFKGFQVIGEKLEKGGVENPTETLITKIMLGVWACVPAFDEYYNKGMQKYWGRGFRHAGTENKLKKIAEFCNTNTDEGKVNLQNLGILAQGHNIKMAKVLDMCFFKAGGA